MSLLETTDLHVHIASGSGEVHAVRGVSIAVEEREIVAVVGESGCGKSSLARALMGLQPSGVTIQGSVRLNGSELLGRSPKDLATTVWGMQVGFVPQDPTNALNPMLRVGEQLTEHTRRHLGIDRSTARARAEELLVAVGIPDPPTLLGRYPHQLSGGMQQRVAIAMALGCDPMLLIADEPTTALDVTVQAQILDLLGDLCDARGMAMVIVSHDLELVLEIADHVNVMYAGTVVEQAPAAKLATNRAMPYTAALLDAVPKLDMPRPSRLSTIDGTPPDLRHRVPGCAFAPRCLYASDECSREAPPLATAGGSGHLVACWHPVAAPPPNASSGPIPAPVRAAGSPVVQVTDLAVEYSVRGSGKFRAVDGMTFDLRRAEILGLVGESGCGKSTLGRAVVGLHEPVEGAIEHLQVQTRRAGAAEVQLIFQDARGSLNPRRRVEDIVAERLAITHVPKPDRAAAAAQLLTQVGLDPALYGRRRPRQLSGGQAQRVAIARALAAEPDVLVCDEPVSALDVSVQAQIINLIMDVRDATSVAVLFIAHDLAAVRAACDRVAVMYLGTLCEIGAADDVLTDPLHPYTRALVASAPGAGTRAPLRGDPPSHESPPTGCRFRARCPAAIAECATHRPPLIEISPGHHVACHVVAHQSQTANDTKDATR